MHGERAAQHVQGQSPGLFFTLENIDQVKHGGHQIPEQGQLVQ